MAEPFLAEIKIVGFNFAPRGWAMCDGQILPIDQNQSLFSLLGTTYGGDGRSTFALPELRGRTPVHPGDGISLGQRAGDETATLGPGALPAHSHGLRAVAAGGTTSAGSEDVLAGSSEDHYGLPGAEVEMATGSISETGGRAHNNMQPFLALNFVIALRGLFPPRN